MLAICRSSSRVRIGGGLWDQQNKQQVDRGAIDGIEIDRRVQVQQRADRCLTAFEATVRRWRCRYQNRWNPVFTGNQSLEDILHLQFGHFPGDQVGNLFEGFLLAAARHVHEGTAGVRMVLSRIMGGEC